MLMYLSKNMALKAGGSEVQEYSFYRANKNKAFFVFRYISILLRMGIVEVKW